MLTLIDFVRESNRIEGIHREPSRVELAAHDHFLSLDALTASGVARLVQLLANAPLRDRPGMDVRVGAYCPPAGGPEIRRQLADLLVDINGVDTTPWQAHVRYERLHPFLDGNGRSGRAIWAWQMLRDGRSPFALGFLHSFYYQTLAASERGEGA